jgi:hypothetical protein
MRDPTHIRPILNTLKARAVVRFARLSEAAKENANHNNLAPNPAAIED